MQIQYNNVYWERWVVPVNKRSSPPPPSIFAHSPRNPWHSREANAYGIQPLIETIQRFFTPPLSPLSPRQSSILCVAKIFIPRVNDGK